MRGTNYPIKKYSELTEDGKKHAYKQQNAVLKKGTRVTCLKMVESGTNLWLKIPSGFICRVLQWKTVCKINFP